MGEIARRLHQPPVLGEIIAGVLLGPSFFKYVAPQLQQYLFPQSGTLPIALEGITTLSITLFLLTAGMGVSLSTLRRQGKASMVVSITGIVFPFTMGFLLAWNAPVFIGLAPGVDRLVFALFFAAALTITALPVVARILMDLNLFGTDFGVLVISAAVIDDLTGWIVFSLVMGLNVTAAHQNMGIQYTIILTFVFITFILTGGRWWVNRALFWIQEHTKNSRGTLGFAVSVALFCAAFTEWIGIHAIFGAFLFGIALGDSRYLSEKTRYVIDQFISIIFAPLFFASIGLRINFVNNFDPLLTVTILAVASAGKVFGCALGARLGGLPAGESWAVGFGMNARGVMEIILGVLALKAGIIQERLFVSIVIIALVTSMTSGSLIRVFLKRKNPKDSQICFSQE